MGATRLSDGKSTLFNKSVADRELTTEFVSYLVEVANANNINLTVGQVKCTDQSGSLYDISAVEKAYSSIEDTCDHLHIDVRGEY